MKLLKLQSALEYLSAYSWALIILAVVAVIFFLIFQKSPTTTFSPSYCYISTGFQCYQLIVSTNSLGSMAILAFTNNLGKPVYFNSNSGFSIKLTGTSSYSQGSCTPTTASSGEQITCIAYIPGFSPVLGTQLEPQFFFNYTECVSSNCNNKASLLTLSTAGSSVSYAYPANILLQENIISIPPGGGPPSIVPPGGSPGSGSTTTVIGQQSTTTITGEYSTTTVIGEYSTTTVIGEYSTTTSISTSSSSSSSSTSTSISSSSSSSSSSSTTSFTTSTSSLTTNLNPIQLKVCQPQNTYVYYSTESGLYSPYGSFRNSSYIPYLAVYDEQHNNLAQFIQGNMSNFIANPAYYNHLANYLNSFTGFPVETNLAINGGYVYYLLYNRNGSSGISIINTSDYGLRGMIINNLPNFSGYVPEYITVGNDSTIYTIYNSTNTASPSLIVSAITPTAGQSVISNNKDYFLKSSDIRSVIINSTNIGNVGDVADAVLYQNINSGSNYGDYLYLLMGTTNINNPSPTLIVINFTIGTDSIAHSIYNVVNIYPEQTDGAIALANGGANAYFTAGNNLVEISTLPSDNSQITGYASVSDLPYNLTGLSMTANGLGAYAIDNSGDVFYVNLQSSSGTLIYPSSYQVGGITTSTDGNYLYSTMGLYSQSSGYYDKLNTQSPITSNALQQYVSSNLPGYLYLMSTFTKPVLSCQNQDNSYILGTLNQLLNTYSSSLVFEGNYTINESAYNYKALGPFNPFINIYGASNLFSDFGSFTNYKNLQSKDTLVGQVIPDSLSSLYTLFSLINITNGNFGYISNKTLGIPSYPYPYDGPTSTPISTSSTHGSNLYFLDFGNPIYTYGGGVSIPSTFTGNYNTSANLGWNSELLNEQQNSFHNSYLDFAPGGTSGGIYYAPQFNNMYLISAPSSNLNNGYVLTNLTQAIWSYAKSTLGIANPQLNVSIGSANLEPILAASGFFRGPEYGDYPILAGYANGQIYVYSYINFYGDLLTGNATAYSFNSTANSIMNNYNFEEEELKSGDLTPQQAAIAQTNATEDQALSNWYSQSAKKIEQFYNEYYLSNNQYSLGPGDRAYGLVPNYLLPIFDTPQPKAPLSGIYQIAINPITGSVDSMQRLAIPVNESIDNIVLNATQNKAYILATYDNSSSYGSAYVVNDSLFTISINSGNVDLITPVYYKGGTVGSSILNQPNPPAIGLSMIQYGTNILFYNLYNYYNPYVHTYYNLLQMYNETSNYIKNYSIRCGPVYPNGGGTLNNQNLYLTSDGYFLYCNGIENSFYDILNQRNSPVIGDLGYTSTFGISKNYNLPKV